MKRIVFTLICFLYLLNIWGQQVQFFTPNAENLARYGQIPVDYFNGLPNISIPISEIKLYDYVLPVSLSYHASGNKPDQHPGWVGMGWTLNAGGAISRKVNCYKDEMDITEFNYQISGFICSGAGGYLNDISRTNTVDWDSQTYLFGLQSNYCKIDYEPDEFMVNVNGINASFYIVNNVNGKIDVKIKSKYGDNFKIDIALKNDTCADYFYKTLIGKTHLFTHISQITLTNKDGIKYIFGGDKESIEFSYVIDPTDDVIIGTPNTWNLTKIVLTNNQEIKLKYKRGGIPIIENKVHSFGVKGISGTDYIDSYNTRNRPYSQYSYAFIVPSYLTSISSSDSHRLDFGTRQSLDLTQLDNNAFTELVKRDIAKRFLYNCSLSELEDFTASNYYSKLDIIYDGDDNIYKGKRIVMQYIENDSSRLSYPIKG